MKGWNVPIYAKMENLNASDVYIQRENSPRFLTTISVWTAIEVRPVLTGRCRTSPGSAVDASGPERKEVCWTSMCWGSAIGRVWSEFEASFIAERSGLTGWRLMSNTKMSVWQFSNIDYKVRTHSKDVWETESEPSIVTLHRYALSVGGGVVRGGGLVLRWSVGVVVWSMEGLSIAIAEVKAIKQVSG